MPVKGGKGTSYLIGALCLYDFVVQLSDLSFLSGGEGIGFRLGRLVVAFCDASIMGATNFSQRAIDGASLSRLISKCNSPKKFDLGPGEL